jgi:hypothetical protein
MNYHVCMSYIMYAFGVGTVIVSQRWPHPRWFIGTGSAPPSSGVVADGIDVVADGDPVIAS